MSGPLTLLGMGVRVGARSIYTAGDGAGSTYTAGDGGWGGTYTAGDVDGGLLN